MGSSRAGQRHLERRGMAFFRRRRWLRHPGETLDPIHQLCLVLSLKTKVPRDAKPLSRRLTQMSDRAFAAAAETMMALSTEQERMILVTLARFEIEAFEQTRRGT